MTQSTTQIQNNFLQPNCGKERNAVIPRLDRGIQKLYNVTNEHRYQLLPGDQSKWVPPDPISNSEVKPFSANDSVD